MEPVFLCMKGSQRQYGRGKAHQVGEGWYYWGCKVRGRKYSGRERWWQPNLGTTVWNASGIKFCLIFRIKDASMDEAGINTNWVFSVQQDLNIWFFWTLPYPLSHRKCIKSKGCWEQSAISGIFSKQTTLIAAFPLKNLHWPECSEQSQVCPAEWLQCQSLPHKATQPVQQEQYSYTKSLRVFIFSYCLLQARISLISLAFFVSFFFLFFFEFRCTPRSILSEPKYHRTSHTQKRATLY